MMFFEVVLWSNHLGEENYYVTETICLISKFHEIATIRRNFKIKRNVDNQWVGQYTSPTTGSRNEYCEAHAINRV